jgi:hypothetical protein
MRFAFLITVLAMILSSSCKNGPGGVTGKELSEIKFEKTTFNYGQIKQGSDGQCKFEFTNHSKVPLIINTVKTSCGCTNPQWTKEPVNPGEKGYIMVSYNTSIKGAFRKSITVYSNARNSPNKLFITGEVTVEK